MLKELVQYLFVQQTLQLGDGGKIVDKDGNTLVDVNGVSVADVITTPITGFVSGAGTVAATDTILQAFNKVDGNANAKIAGAGTVSQYAVLRFSSTTGKAVEETVWLINASDALVPTTDNAKDIGNLASNPRDIHASRTFIKKGIASTEGYGQCALKSISASKAFAGGGTEVIPVQVPSGAKIVGCQLRNDTILTATTGVSYSAAYSTGSTQAIGSGIDFAKNVKTDKFFDANAATDITSGLTDITLTPNAGTLDTGTVTAIVYYYELTTMSSAA